MRNFYQEDLHSVKVPNLEILCNKNILVTGATGLVGSALVDLLLLYCEQYNFHIYAGCRSKQRFNLRFKENQFLHFFHLDVTQALTIDIDFEYIVHAASGASPSIFATDPVGVMKSNLLGTFNLLDYGIHHRLNKFVYISSGEVYGEGSVSKWTESDSGFVDTMFSRSCYPSSKRSAETICASYASQYGIDCMVARLSHTYGPYFTKSDNRVYAQFLRNVLSGQDIILKSLGLQYRSWLYVVDCVSAILFIMVNGKSGEAYNVANEESNVTIRQLATIVANLTGKNLVYDLSNNDICNGATPIVKAIFDTKKITKIGWIPQTTLNDGLMHTIETLRLESLM